MTAQAIKLSQANLHRILNESPIPRPDLEAMIEEYEPQLIPLYFIPKAQDEDVVTTRSWMTAPGYYLAEHFDYDKTKIDTQFVDITWKG